MSQDQLLTYIKTQLASGFTKENIVQTLLSAGYQQQAIDQALLTLASSPVTASSTQLPSKPLNQAQISQTTTPSTSDIPSQGNSNTNEPSVTKPPFFTKKRLLFVLLPLLLLLIIGIAAWYFITNSPAYVLSQAYERSKNIKTFSYDATMKASFDFSFPNFGSFDASSSSQLGFSDDYTQGNLAQPKEKNTFVLTMNMKGSSDFSAKPKHSYTGEISIGDGDLNSLGGAVEMRTLDDNIYLRIAKFPNFGLFDTASLTNQWIKVEKKDLEGSYLQSDKKNQELTPDEIQKLQEMVKKANIISVTKTLSAESIENQPSHHYQLAINKKNLENFLNDASVILAKTDDDTNYYKDMKNYLSKVDFKRSELWIGKKEKYVTRILMEISGNKTQYGDVSFLADVKMKDMNKPVSIIAPLDAKPLKDIFPSRLDMYSDFATDSASLSQPQAAPTPIILPYGTVLGDETKRDQQSKEHEVEPLTPAEQLVNLFLLQLLPTKPKNLSR